ncbi:phage terminase large subunit [Curtobacterium sp. C1]|uniref:phage terminase large subunit n=1 Tax=Curtobacterium sp. C1 TaxID=2898151 RepID=UPI001E5F719E|nr:phage terminase large subunit [Curtobacterium sp. C1]UFU14624.1 phage terminase large subunit [Curtobacterium sp. C1]
MPSKLTSPLSQADPSDLAAFRAALRNLGPPEHTYATPGDLARAINPKTVQTPALDIIDRELVRAYNTRDARLIVSMPPQEGKSERVTKTGTLWALLQDPDRRFAIASYSQELAEGFGRDIRNWIVSNDGEDGMLDLGLRVARDNGAARRWRLDGKRGGVVSVGVQSSLTGRPVDALVIDDPFKDSVQADSSNYRDMVWAWWQSTASTRLAPGAPVIVILTRWHEDDLAGRLQAAEDGHLWRVVNIPALADHDPAKGQTDPLDRTPGTWLPSARGRTPAEWDAIRTRAGSRVFNALYQGRPSPATGDVWQRSWWRRYDQPLWSEDVAAGTCRLNEVDDVILSWDMTFKDTKASDFVVGQVWARRGADVYLIDQIKKRMSFTDTKTAFEAMVKRWPQATAKLIEDKANGTAVIDSLRKTIPGIVPITPKDSKYSRANAVAPFIEAGNVHLPSKDVALFDVDDLLDEATSFPNAAHDDQVDATSQALARLLLRVGEGSAFLQHMKNQLGDQPKTSTRNWRVTAQRMKEGGTDARTGRPQRP